MMTFTEGNSPDEEVEEKKGSKSKHWDIQEKHLDVVQTHHEQVLEGRGHTNESQLIFV